MSYFLFNFKKRNGIINRMHSTGSQYRNMLGALEGDAFEDVVCERLQAAYVDFQPIPRKPQGDGGLDGLSHRQERCYCCYGPEQEQFKVNTKGLKPDVIKKFRGDLHKIFELEVNGRNSLVHKASTELPTILADGKKIKNVYLVVSVFDTHQIIGPLNTAFQKCKDASSCNFIEKDATLAIWGPTQVLNLLPPDETAIFRIEQRMLAKVLATTDLDPIIPNDKQEFEKKFEYLKALKPTSEIHQTRINRLQEGFKRAWGTALAVEKRLAETSVSLHQSLEKARDEGMLLADIKSAQSSDPLQLVEVMLVEMEDILKKTFENPSAPNLRETAKGEVARLIGECPLEWRP